MTPAALERMFCGLVKVELVSKTGACEMYGVNRKLWIVQMQLHLSYAMAKSRFGAETYSEAVAVSEKSISRTQSLLCGGTKAVEEKSVGWNDQVSELSEVSGCSCCC